MKKFIITEEERRRILNLYEESPFSEFTQLFARSYGVSEEEFSKVNIVTGKTNMDIYKEVILGPLKKQTIESARTPGGLDNILGNLNKLYSGQYNFSNKEKVWLGEIIRALTEAKPQLEKTIQGFSEEQWENFWRSHTYANNQNTETQPQQQTSSNEKINTTNDKAYDYKLSDGKYYYSVKGQDNWIEAKGKGLQAIKQKVKF
jgi:hypothetical protein